MDKNSMSAKDICAKFIASATVQAGGDSPRHVREAFSAPKVIIMVCCAEHLYHASFKSNRSQQAGIGNPQQFQAAFARGSDALRASS